MSSNNSNNTEPQDSHLLLIDGKLSSGWVSYVDLSITLNEICGYPVRKDEDLQKYVSSLMKHEPGSTAGGYYTSRIKSIINKITKVWTVTHKGSQGTPNQTQKEEIIEWKWIYPDDDKAYLSQFSLSDATSTHLEHGSRGQRIRIFRYRIKGYSIADDLKLYNEKIRLDSVSRNQKQITSKVKYNDKEAKKYIVSPEPDVIERKISALKIRALQDALRQETNEAIKRRIAEIEYLTSKKPIGWENKTINLYLNAIYDASGVLDNGEVAPIIQQFQSHMLNHFSLDYFPSSSIEVILDYKKYCSWKLYPKIARSVSSLAQFIKQEDYSSEDIDIIRDRCWLAASKFGDLDDEQFEEVATLSDAVYLLMNSTTYIYNMSGFSAALILYGIDSDIDLNTIVSCMDGQVKCLIHDFTNDYIDYFKKAEAVFLTKCKSIIGSLDKDNATERFIIGLINMSIAFVTRSITPIDDILPKSIIAEGLELLNTEEKGHFNELLQTLRFDELYKAFTESAGCDILSTATQEAFILMMNHLLANLAVGNIWLENESYHHQKLVLKLKEYIAKVSLDQRCSRFKGYSLLLKYTLAVIENKPFPLDIREGCTPKLCESTLNAVFDEARQMKLQDSGMQLLMLVLSMIALRHIDYYVPKEDEDEDRAYNAGILEKAIQFLPVSEYFMGMMSPGSEKDLMKRTLSIVKEKGFYNGYIL